MDASKLLWRCLWGLPDPILADAKAEVAEHRRRIAAFAER